IDDALGRGRVIGLVQPRERTIEPVPDDAVLYDVGTVGRIVSFHDPDGGRYHLTLQGISRFRTVKELPFEPTRGYRQVEADFAPFTADLTIGNHNDDPGRERILELMRGYFSSKGIDADWDAVAQASFDSLVASLTMTCPFEPGEKQALLECQSHAQRAKMLISLFEMSMTSGSPPNSLAH
ncbi:MAG TPA: LON peptidase substrate-binding domain-containing protein, partial [Magnetovibrio sp.]